MECLKMISLILEETQNPSEIQKFYSNSCVLITGATGFVGQLLLEKLLRSCPDIKKIYVLTRGKNGQTAEKRFEELFKDKLYDILRKIQPNFAEKIVVFTGDCALPDLGLSEDAKQKIINEVNCIFHCAATVRFNEKLRTALQINVRAIRDLINLAQKITYLRCFVYVSTAYSHCYLKKINEDFHKPPITGKQMLSILDLDEEILDQIAPILCGSWPNTYAFTKAIAEEIIQSHSHNLPICIIRPAVVIGTAAEPLAGWINNFYGATGAFLNISLGLVRIFYCVRSCKANIVPADYVINCIIAVGWDVGTTSHYSKLNKMASNGYLINNENYTNLNGNPYFTNEECQITNADRIQHPDSKVCVYNYVGCAENSVSWGGALDKFRYYFKQLPTPLAVWQTLIFITPIKVLYFIGVFLMHTIPAHLFDLVYMCIGKRPKWVKIYDKINKFVEGMSYFAIKEWEFETDNAESLWKKLNTKDKSLFCFDMTNFDWELYFQIYAKGARIYLLNDPLETLPEGRLKALKLKMANFVVLVLLLFIFYKIVLGIWL